MSQAVADSERLLQWFAPWSSCAVAFSGGVDSAVVACAAHRALGARAVAVTGNSASVAEGELEIARRVARQIGIRHEVLATHEFENPQYVRNAPDRCYHCKTELYDRMVDWLQQFHVEVVLNGANADDQYDYRPGLRAAAEHQVRSPLAECGLNKEQVRAVARLWELPVWDKPASPCLSSRVAYGEEVTPQRLAMIDGAERFLRERGFPVVRVRYHRGDLARVEVPEGEIDRVCEAELRRAMTEHFTALGFRCVTVDLSGFRSGNLNSLVSLVPLDTETSGTTSSTGDPADAS
jgi:pyridinium-3,5-biscarboxylic acid mononucleotide sulfurtransferase